jgi:DNA-binding transcriptional ArsR family regulator
VDALAAPFRISRPAISKHLDVLEQAGLIRRVRVGRESRCQLNAAALKAVDTWVERYRRHWTERLDALAEYLEKEATQ